MRIGGRLGGRAAARPDPASPAGRRGRMASGLLAAALVLGGAGGAGALPFDALVSFGDSLSDVGSGPPEPPGHGGRSSNGPLWHEYLATDMGLGADATRDFAIGGATSGTDGVQGPGVGLLAQVETYAAAPPSVGTRPLFTVWAGGNDALGAAFGGGPLDPEALAATAAANIASAVGTLADAGARDFLVPDLPDAGLFPIASQFGLGAEASAYTAALNADLETELAALDPSLNILRLDAFDLFEALVADPDAFGLSVVDAGCVEDLLGAGEPCDDPGAHLFWDPVHPTTGVHALLGERAFRAVPEPAPALLLAAGLAAAGGLARVRGRAARARGR